MAKGNRGGRRSGGSSTNIPKLNNPAGIPSNAMTEDEFLGLRGVRDAMSGFSVDKMRSNKMLGSNQGRKQYMKQLNNANMTHQQKRDAARAEYQALIKSGKIRDKTPDERRLTVAHGHPDLQATQAARRLLAKKGIDWRTGKKL